jgi:hypothetical protein
MTEYRNNARFAGAMFLLAMAASLTGGFMIESVIKPDFFSAVQGKERFLIVGIILELTNALAVVGIAAAFWPVLKKERPATAAWYFAIRILECAACIAAAFMAIVMTGLIGREATGGTELVAEMLTMMRDAAASYMIPLFFAASAFFLYVMLYGLKLIPRYISVWGMAAAAAITIVPFYPAFALRPVLALPIILNEIYLGFYLLIRGFRRTMEHNPGKKAYD